MLKTRTGDQALVREINLSIILNALRAHALRRERHGIERGRHADPAAGRARRFDANCGRDDGRDGREGEDRNQPSAHNENESYHTRA